MRKILVLAVLFLVIPLAPLTTSAAETPEVKITEVYYHTGPGCEYIKLENWGDPVTLDNYSISDGEGELSLPQIELKKGEELVLAENREGYKEIWHSSPDLTWAQDSVELIGNFHLSYSEDEVILKSDDKVVDAFFYGEGEETGDGWEGKKAQNLWKGSYAKRKNTDQNNCEDWNWTRDWKVGHSDLETKDFSFYGNASFYVSPDSSYDSMMRFLDDVQNRLTICVYEIKNMLIAEKIANLSDEGVDVSFLVEGSPVGGMTDQEMVCLDRIRGSGADVRVIGSEFYSPYNFVHCKYMIKDDTSVLISSENFGYTGYSPRPSYGNRGWGVILEEKNIADYLQDVFEHDWRFGKTLASTSISVDETYVQPGNYIHHLDEKSIEDEFKVTPVISPDSSMAGDTILGMIRSSEESIKVEQFYAQDWDNRSNPYIKALIKAARRGIEVNVILDSTWYNLEGENNNTGMLERLNSLADEEALPLEARLINSEHKLEKVHNKGMIVDGKKVLVSSINWNANSVLQNREIGVIIENKAAARYFEKVFDKDWKNDVVEPIADAGRDRTVKKGRVINFDASNSWDDGNITTFSWDLDGDGTYETKGEKVTKVYDKTGEVKIRLLVVDEEGNTDVDTTTIDIEKVQNIEFIEQDKDEGSNHVLIYIVGAVTAVILLIIFYKTKNKKD